MKQKIQIRRLYKAKHFPQILFFCWVFLVFDKKWQNPRENQKAHQKKQRLGDYMRPDISLKSLFIVFLFFFGFLKVVATFGQKPKKTSRNQKKNEKQKKKHEKKKTKD